MWAHPMRVKMGDKSQLPSATVLPFPAKERSGHVTSDTWDHGPSPEESLRLMRAFVAIRNKPLRENLTEMLEDASRAYGQLPSRAKTE